MLGGMDCVPANTDASPLPPPIVVGCRGADLDDLLGREWLIANDIGAYASGTAAGCNTRRYHGLLVAATAPPVGRVVALANVMETLLVGQTPCDLGINEFDGAFSPRHAAHLVSFTSGLIPSFRYECSGATLAKEVLLAESANAVAVRYTYQGPAATLRVRPLVAMRDFHHTRAACHGEMTSCEADEGIVVHDDEFGEHDLHMAGPGARFLADGQWWRGFHYRADTARGYCEADNLYSPGEFAWELDDGGSCIFTAGLDEPLVIAFDSALARRRERLAALAESVGPEADAATRRLAAATEVFVVQRTRAARSSSTTILAGYHWFADWGRDAFIALPGLLLATGRFDDARQVFRTFSEWTVDGLVPNYFDDYAEGAHYNSIDAPLWLCIAAERYVAATGDENFFNDTLGPLMHGILTALREGTRFDIRADADGLLTGGNEQTQLTWMDAKSGGRAITPRHGKAVEINALWYSAHRNMADRCKRAGDDRAELYSRQANMIAPTFVRTFWNDRHQCLFDCVGADRISHDIRPNQIFAVSLPYSPLSGPQQVAVVDTVHRHLLTPVGLRTLSPEDPAYCGRFGGDAESRDRAYHQGTVWPWLIGPFIEAYLKVERRSPAAVTQAKQWLAAFDAHLSQAGLGYVGEVFDGDPPHAPGGCIAQAWSVAEVLRAKLLVQSGG